MPTQPRLGGVRPPACGSLRTGAAAVLLVTLTLASGPAAALAVFASARADFINGASAGFETTTNVDSPGLSIERMKGPGGFAEGTVAVGTATIGLDTVVNMTTQVTLSASATGSFTETFSLGDHYCIVNGGCQTLGALGVAFIDFTFGIHAAGSVDASRASTFDRAISGLDFTWELITDAGNIAFGGGAASARREANIEESSDTVDDGSAVVRMRPGDGLELRLRAHGESLANGAGGRADSRVLFSNTLRWDGVHDFTAFDAQGRVLNLAPGQFTLRGVDTGFDYWNAAGRAVSGVPEPGPWALLLGPLGWLALRRNRQRSGPGSR